MFGLIAQKLSSCLNSFDTLLTCTEPVVSCMVVAGKQKDLRQSKSKFETLMTAMGIPDIKNIPLDKPISELGMGSLGGAEIQQALQKEFGISMTLQELRSIKLRELQTKVNGRL